MNRSLASFVVLLAFLACVHPINASVVSIILLQSHQPPIFSAKNEALGLAAFFQEDGSVTFVGAGGTLRPQNFSCVIDTYHQGRAYAILGVSGESVRILSVVGTSAFGLHCSASHQACEPIFPIIPLPISDKSPVLAIEPLALVPDQVLLATMDTFIVLSVSTMAPLASIKWAGKPYLSQYQLDTVSIVQGTPEVNGHPLLVVLASKRTGWKAPGVGISLLLADLGRSIRIRTTTFFDSSPTNVHIPLGFHIYYWTQLDRNVSSTVYVNSKGGWPRSPPLVINLPPGSSLSPSCFGEYPITSSGVICAGDANRTQTMYGLHLAFGQGIPPEISPGQVTSAPIPVGALQWAIQPNRLLPHLFGVVQLPQGSYAIEVFEFTYMGTPNLSPYRRANKGQDIRQTIAPSSAHDPHSSLSEAAPNCIPSKCSFDEPGDCPPEHCWVFGGTGQFLCCLKPPI